MANAIEEFDRVIDILGKTPEDYRYLLQLLKRFVWSDIPSKEKISREERLTSLFYIIPEDVLTEFIEIVNKQMIFDRDERNQAKYNQVIYALFLRVGYVPKIVDACLNIIDSPYSEAKWKRSAYMTLGGDLFSFGLKEEGYEYLMKTYEYAENISVTEECGAAANLLFSVVHLKKNEEIEKYRNILYKIAEENKDNLDVRRLVLSSHIDMAWSYIALNDFGKEDVEKLIRCYEEYVACTYLNSGCYHNLDTEEAALIRIKEAGYDKESAKILSIIMDNRDCFQGAVPPIIKIFKEFIEKENEYIPSEKRAEYKKIYGALLEEYYNNTSKLIDQLTKDEFKLFAMEQEYVSIKNTIEIDPLTKAKNRATFDESILDFYRSKPEGSLVFMDIDGLKESNDMYGHEIGDELLRQFSKTFLAIVDEGRDSLFRYAGDEFILLTSRDIDEVGILLEKVKKEMDKVKIASTNIVGIKFSYGISRCKEVVSYDDEKEAVNNVIRLADKRMYECKRAHKEQVD